MAHDVKYAGKLTPVKPLSEDEIKLFKLFQDDSKNYDRLYALEYKNEGFMVDNSNEKIYPDDFFDSIEKYVLELKKGGNDLKDGSYLISCSEYGFDGEAMVLSYKNGAFDIEYLQSAIERYLTFKK